MGFYDSYSENSVGYVDGHGAIHRHRMGMTQFSPLNLATVTNGWDGKWVRYGPLEEYYVY